MSESEEKERGMKVSATKNWEILGLARSAANALYEINGVADIVEVRRLMDDLDVKFTPGNWMGSVFKGGGWKPTGRFVQTTHKGSHRRWVREWTK